MPVGVIDRFKIINIDHQNGKIFWRPCISFNQRINVAIKRFAVINTSESIGD
jgi:hypothetical protein